jgi:hypothetical protein
MICTNQDCTRQVPSNAKFCAFCGTELKSQPLDLDKIEFSSSIKLTQKSSLPYGDLPQLVIYKEWLVCPDSYNDTFRVYNLADQNKEIGSSEIILGNIIKSTTPLFDGIYFNVIKGNYLYRFRVTRDLNIKSDSIPYYSQAIRESVNKPSILQINNNRYLLFIADLKLFIIDLSSKEISESSIRSVPMPTITTNGKWYPIVISSHAKKVLFFSTSGSLFFSSFDAFGGREKIVIEKFCEIDSDFCSPPVIMQNNFVFISRKNNNSHNFIVTDLLNSITLQFNLDNTYEIKYELIHSEHKVFLFDSATKNRALGIDLKGNSQQSEFKESLNLENNCVLNNFAYSFSKDRIHVFNLRTSLIANVINLADIIGVRFSPLSRIILEEGILAFQCSDSVQIKKM